MSPSEGHVSLAAVEQALGEHGLVSRGAFHPDSHDQVPDTAGGAVVATLIMAGNVGPSMWRSFSRSQRAPDHPLDHWSRGVLEQVAAQFGGVAFHPSDGPPWLPFQRWAQKADTVWPSPLGILVHPEHGLWHAYRGAIGLPVRLDLPARQERQRPCDTCADWPCMTTCPVGAFTDAHYDVPACVDYLESPDGADCLDNGCAARRACPVGREFIYEPAHAAFHMAAFVRKYGKSA